jgi:putative glutamine amidotransferase
VARGGTVIPDIVDYAPHHGAPGEPEFVDEPIDIVPGTRLSSILGTDRVIGRSGQPTASISESSGIPHRTDQRSGRNTIGMPSIGTGMPA